MSARPIADHRPQRMVSPRPGLCHSHRMRKKPPAPPPSRQELEQRAMEIFRATKARLGGDRIEEIARRGGVFPAAPGAAPAPPSAGKSGQNRKS
jgi:hypothetical protein